MNMFGGCFFRPEHVQLRCAPYLAKFLPGFRFDLNIFAPLSLLAITYPMGYN